MWPPAGFSSVVLSRAVARRFMDIAVQYLEGGLSAKDNLPEGGWMGFTCTRLSTGKGAVLLDSGHCFEETVLALH